MKILKAYREDWINNKYILNKMEHWKSEGLVSPQKLTEAKEKLKVGFKHYNIFAKIGLFIFSWIGLSSVTSIIAMPIWGIIDESEVLLKVLTLVFGFLLFALLELLINKGSFYRSGPDNLVLYSATSTLIAGLCFIGGFDFDLSYYFLIATIVLALVTIRYADPFMSLCLFISFVGLVFVLVTKSEIGKLIIPFVLMAVAAFLYFANNKWLTSFYYQSSQKVIKAAALTLFYLGGNYLVVREGNALLAGITDSIEISFSWLFWGFTFLTPLIYLAYSLRSKDRLMLHLGILGVVASLVTYHNYYDQLPVEIWGCIIGLILIVSSIVLSRWLKTERSGITSNPTKGNQNAEGLMINEVIQSSLGNGPNQDGVNFGGGSFGGGGAGSGY